jgi:hypothetical protein
MKLLSTVLLILASSRAFSQSDVRSVNGMKVDLAPLHQWYITKTGDRPFKHWRMITLTESQGRYSQWERFDCRDESGTKLNIMLDHLPEKLIRFMKTVSKQSETVKQLTEAHNQQAESFNQLLNEVEFQQKKVQNDDREMAIYAGNLSASDYANNTRRIWNDHDILSQKQQRLSQMQSSITETDRELLAAGKELEKAWSKSGETMTVFAMFTGHIYSDVPLWDCGEIDN